MKFLIFILISVLAFANAFNFENVLEAQQRSLSTQVADMIEAIKIQMPCGFEKMGLPSLAPVAIRHKQIDVNTTKLGLKGVVEKVCIRGFNEFDIIEFNINALFSKFNFKFQWKDVNVTTIYNLLMRMEDFEFKQERSGDAFMSLRNINVWGNGKYKMGILGGTVQLKEFYVFANVEEVESKIENLSKIKFINRKINEIIEEWISLAINDNTENLGDMVNDIVVPTVNNMIGDRTLKDIIAIIVGGGGSGEVPPKEECVPPEEVCLFN